MKYGITTSLLALACCSAQAQSTPQSTIEVYGVADAGLVIERGGNGASTKVGSGLASGSRIGFKGSEDLGNGLSAGFVLESGVNIDAGTSGQGGLTFGRQSYVSLSSSTLGSISAGRQYSPYYKVLRDVADPFGDGLAGQAANLMVPNARMDNAVLYATPDLAGWSANVAYGAGEAAGNSSRKRALSGAVNYSAGPVAVSLAHHRREDALASTHARNSMLAARYTMGAYQLHAAYADNRGMGTVGGSILGTVISGSSSGISGGGGLATLAGGAVAAGPVGAPGVASRDLLLGLCATFGPHSFAGSVVQHADRSAADKDARQFGVAYLYALSKRTDVYTAYARIRNTNGATFTVGNASDDGKGHSAINIGLRHLL